MIFQGILLRNAASITDPPPEPDPELGELVFMDGVVNKTGTELLLDSGTSSVTVEGHYKPRLLYHNGKTHFCYMRRESDGYPYGQVMLLTFDKDKGFDVPITVGDVMIPHISGVGDTHTVPTELVIKDPTDDIDKLYILQERTHLVPFEVYKDTRGDQSYFTKPFNIGVNLAYGHPLIKNDGHALIWCRGGALAGDANHQYSIYVVESSNYFEGLNGATPRRITQKEGTGLWHYPFLPNGFVKVGTRFCLLIARRTGTPDGGTYQDVCFSQYYRLYTEDFVTYTNKSGSFSHNTSGANLITASILQTNFMYHATSGIEDQGKLHSAAQSSEGDFYAVVRTGEGGDYKFIYEDVDDTFIKKTITIADLTDYGDLTPTNPFGYIMPYARNDIRILVDVTIGLVNEQHWFKTTDLGDTWEDLGDVRPSGVSAEVKMLIPNNAMQIPLNTNFPVYFSYADGTYTGGRGMYCTVAAWGEVQTIPGVPVTASTGLNYNSQGLFDYEFVEGKITKSGNNISALTDNFGVYNATGVNSPQWVSPDAVAFTAANSRSFNITTPTNILNKNSLTLFAVIKGSPAASSPIFCCSLNSAAAAFFEVTLDLTGKINYRIVSTNTALNTSQDAINDGNYHVICVTIDGRARPDIYVDGKRQYFENTTLTGASSVTLWNNVGKGPALVSANTANIGRRDVSGTDVYSTFELKRIALLSGVLPYNELQSRIKYLCDTYGVTYVNQFQIPT